MAYSVNGKVFTDHPLMDEIAHAAKIIISKIVVKNDILANDCEVEDCADAVEVFLMIKNGTISFSVFPFTPEILAAFGYDSAKIRAIIRDKNIVPEGKRDELLQFACNYFLEHYEEKNNYYRMLMGIPAYDSDGEFDIYINQSYLPKNYKKEVDFSRPIHLMDNNVIRILQTTGGIDRLLSEYRGSNYSYLRFLGSCSIDLYKARTAKKFQILYFPTVENLIQNRFIELYNLNRDIYLKRTYSIAYGYDSDHYEQMMIFMILSQTFNDLIVDVPEWYIRRDIFDLRSVEYFLEAYGVAYYKIIPLKYQVRIVKNLNKLIKYKSSNKNFEDILEIFALKNTSIYKYYLFKKRLVDSFGNYIGGDDEEKKFELEFVQAKINESYDDYIKDLIYRTQYDVITLQDKYWDGQNEHSLVKSNHLARDFTIEGTKYMSIEYRISLSEYLFQMQYFVGLIMDSRLDSNDITIGIPSIESDVEFRLSDLFLFLCLLTLNHDECSTDIIRPGTPPKLLYSKYRMLNGGFPSTAENKYKENIDGYTAMHSSTNQYENIDGKYADDSNEIADYVINKKVPKPSFEKYDDIDGGYSYTHEEEYDDLYSVNGGNKQCGYLHADGGSSVEYSEIRSIEYFYDWMKKYMPEYFIEYYDKVYGFNPNVDLKKLEEDIAKRHSEYQFDNGFTLEELGVDKYIIPTKASTIDELTNIYFTNKECYDNLKEKMVYRSDDRNEFRTMNYVFQELFTKQFDYGGYQINNGTVDAKKLEEVLEDRDYILYTTYLKIISEQNLEVRQDNIRSIMGDVIGTLEYYLSHEGLEYIFAFTTINSFSALIKYIYLIINFFKSYKVYFLDPFITYLADDRLENSVVGRDTITEKKLIYWKWDKEFKHDVQNYKVYFDFEEKYRNEIMEAVDIYGRFDPIPEDDYDYNGMYADTENSEEQYKDADGGYADDYSCIPYIMLNGGSASGGRINLWDLDGAGAKEMLDEYVIVDGGYSLHEEDYRTDYWAKAFSYILDGGSASTNQFLSRTIHVKVIDKQVESSIRVSKLSGNKLVVKEDGLYLSEEWASWEDFEEFRDSVDNTFDYFTQTYNDLLEVIEISSDLEILDKKIDTEISNILSNMKLFVSYMDGNSFEKSLTDYVDAGVKRLYDEFYMFSPYNWGSF